MTSSFAKRSFTRHLGALRLPIPALYLPFSSPLISMSNESQELITKGGCFCGAARYRVKGRPIRAAYCHCTLCQRFNAAAFIHTIHWEPTAFSWSPNTHPDTDLDSYNVATKPWKKRYRCKKCGVAIANENTNTGKWSVWGGQLDRDEDAKIKNWEIVKPKSGQAMRGTRRGWNEKGSVVRGGVFS